MLVITPALSAGYAAATRSRTSSWLSHPVRSPTSRKPRNAKFPSNQASSSSPSFPARKSHTLIVPPSKTNSANSCESRRRRACPSIPAGAPSTESSRSRIQQLFRNWSRESWRTSREGPSSYGGPPISTRRFLRGPLRSAPVKCWGKRARQRAQRLRPRPQAVLEEAGPVHGVPEHRPEHLNPLLPSLRQHGVRAVGEPFPELLVLQRLLTDISLGPADRVLTPDPLLESRARPFALRNGRDLLQELRDSREPVRVNPLLRLRRSRPQSVLALQVPPGFGHAAPLSRTLPAPGRE